MQSNKNNNILLYNSTTDFDEQFLAELTLAHTPVTCLQKTAEDHYDLIVVFHSYRSLKERYALMELCSALKKNPFTRHTPLLCLLPSRHRELLKQLQAASVDYVRFYDKTAYNSKEYLKFLLKIPSEDCRIERILPEICPHINYFPISRNQEIMYCGAYRNRLVLGSHRLQHLCETLNHKSCQYFKCPKFM